MPYEIYHPYDYLYPELRASPKQLMQANPKPNNNSNSSVTRTNSEIKSNGSSTIPQMPSNLQPNFVPNQYFSSELQNSTADINFRRENLINCEKSSNVNNSRMLPFNSNAVTGAVDGYYPNVGYYNSQNGPNNIYYPKNSIFTTAPTNSPHYEKSGGTWIYPYPEYCSPQNYYIYSPYLKPSYPCYPTNQYWSQTSTGTEANSAKEFYYPINSTLNTFPPNNDLPQTMSYSNNYNACPVQSSVASGNSYSVDNYQTSGCTCWECMRDSKRVESQYQPPTQPQSQPQTKPNSQPQVQVQGRSEVQLQPQSQVQLQSQLQPQLQLQPQQTQVRYQAVDSAWMQNCPCSECEMVRSEQVNTLSRTERYEIMIIQI